MPMSQKSVTRVAITGTGSYLPEKVLTNLDLEQMVETSDEWIRQRTGIIERRIAEKEIATSDLGTRAARRAIKTAQIDPLDIDLIIVGTATPDSVFPSTACIVQREIGAKNAYAFDLSAACSGFIYGLDLADGMIRSGKYRTALVVGAETFSRIVDWTDRGTCILFGDGAGAAVLQASETDRGIITSYCGSDGVYADPDLLGVPAGGSALPLTGDNIDQKLHKVKMRGREVFKFGVRIMPEAALHTLEMAGLTVNDIDLVIPHQANLRIIEAVGERIGVSADKVYINVDRYGNTSAATVIIALDEAIRSGRIKNGDLVLMVTFGAGLTWGASIIKI